MVDIVTRLGKGSPLTNAEVDANFTNLAEVSGVTGEPMGHEDRTTSTISFNASTRTFTIAPTASSFTVWCKGKKVVVSSARTVTIPNTTGMYSIYFDSTGTLAAKSGYFTFAEEAPTAYIYWNATTGTAPYFGDERHGVVLDWQTHEYLHRTRGAALASGFSASGYVLGGNGSSNSHAQLTLEGGTFFDEDMKIIVTATNTPTAGTWEQDLTSPARIPVLYLSGTAWVIDSPTDYPLKQGTARPQYNAFSGGVWSTADVANNKYATSWILATNNLTYPVIAIIGQAESDLQSAAEAVDFTALQLPGFPSVEFRPLYKLIFQCADSCTNAVHASLVSITDIRSIAAAGTAASIVTDHGNLSGLSDDDHPQYLSVDTVRGSLTAAVKASFLPSQTSNAGKFLQTDGTATSWAVLSSANVTTALGFTPYNATNPSGFISGITSGNVTTALGFTPYNATNPSGYVTAAGARGSISVTGAGSYDSATGVINIVGGVTSFNTRTGAITLSSADVTTALGFTPYNSTNPNGYLTGITSTQVTTALGYTPYNSSNPSGYITGITSGMVTTALGFTPYNNSNPSGYITSAALSPYLTTASAASTYLALSGGTMTGIINMAGTQKITTAGYAGIEYYNTAGNWEGYIGTENNTGNLRYNARLGTHTWYANSTSIGAWDASSLRVSGSVLTTTGASSWGVYSNTNGSNYSGIWFSTNVGELLLRKADGSLSTRIAADGSYAFINNNNILHAGNYNSYSPTLTGTGASGTWAINITGSAATATDSTKLPLAGGTLTGSVSFAQGANISFGTSTNEAGPWTISIIGSGGATPATKGTGFGRNLIVKAGNSDNGGGLAGGDLYLRAGAPTAPATAYGVVYLSDDGGFTQAGGSVRAPIFYDSNNTAYYVDPNGNSLVAQLGVGANNTSYTFYNNGTSYLNGAVIVDDVATFNVNGSSTIFITAAGTNASMIKADGGDELYIGGNNTWQMRFSGANVLMDNGGYLLNGESIRTPIYYDSNNTGYYGDFASTSNINSMNVQGTLRLFSNEALQIVAPNYARQRADSRDEGSASRTHWYGLLTDGNTSNFRHAWYDGAAYFNVTASGGEVSFNRVGGGGYVSSNESLRAPLFYDLNNTGFYVDAASTSNLNAVNFNGVLAWADGTYALGSPSYGFRFNDTASTINAFIIANNGDTTAWTSSRAPIFYDRNNTAYFTDPAGRSRQSQIDFGDGGYYIHGGSWGMRNTTPYGYIEFGPANGGHAHIYTDRSNFYFNAMVQVLGGSQINQSDIRANIFYDQQDTGYYTDPNGTSRMGDIYTNRIGVGQSVNASWPLIVSGNAYLNAGGYGQAEGSWRAPLFYDSNNTGYYIDPNSTSNISDLVVRGGTSVVNISDLTTGTAPIRVTNTGTGTGDVRYIPMISGTSTSSSGYLQHTVLGSVRGTVWGAAFMGVGCNDSYPTVAYTFHYGGYASAPESWRAQIFYDNNDTGYYIDPNSTSRLNTTVTNVSYLGVDTNKGYAQGYGTYSSQLHRIARITFDWNATYNQEEHGIFSTDINGSYSDSMSINSFNDINLRVDSNNNDNQSYVRFHHHSTGSNQFAYVGYDGSQFLAFFSGILYGGSSARSPIFYDYDNTGFYLDPNNTSELNRIGTVRTNNFLYLDNNYGHSVVGVYSSYRYQGVFAMGDAYKLPASGETTGNLYGIAWSHPNAGGTAGNLNTHGALILENGTYLAALSGSIRCRDDMRTPIYYDSNDTGYYTDPNGTSRLNYVVPNRIKLVNNVNNEPRWDFTAYVVEAQHWYGNNSSQTMYLGEANWVNIRNTADIHGDARSPIYYDRNDTTYYADLNSTGTSIRAAGNITAYYSDMRLKTHLGKIENARDKVRQLEGFYYEANELAQSFGYKAKREVGVSAQAVQAVLPEIVTDAPINSNYLTIDYERLTPLLIEAIKEQDTELVDLRNRVAQLESLINKLIGD